MKEAPKDITFLYCLLERDQGRLLHFERNLKILPSIEKFSAVNGYDPVETLAEMMDNDIVFNAKDLKFQKSWVNKNGVKIVEDEKDAGTFGTLANWITKFKCLKYQIENQLPYICIMEDDLILKDSFFEVISDCVKDLKSNPKKTHSRIAAWGECFVFSLDGAKKTLDMLLEVGFQYPIGRQLSNEPPFSKNCMRKKHSEITSYFTLSFHIS